jgi:hypothetical protein
MIKHMSIPLDFSDEMLIELRLGKILTFLFVLPGTWQTTRLLARLS